MKKRAAEVVDPRLQFLNMEGILKREMSVNGGFVRARTQGRNQWRNVDLWDKTETHPKNSPRRELALLADIDEPMYGEDYATGQFYEMLLDWASDSNKCDFLKDIRARFSQLKNADSRNPNDELEALAIGCWAECKKYLMIPTSMEQLMAKHSHKAKYKKFPNFCKMRIVFVMSHMIDLKKDTRV